MKRYPFAVSIIAILAAIVFSAQLAPAARAENVPAAAEVAGVIRLERVEEPDAGEVASVAAAPLVDGAPRAMGLSRTPGGTTIPRLYGSSAAMSSLPAAHDLTISELPVGNQGSQSSCVGWAVGYYYKSYVEALQHGWDASRADRRFSPSWVYNQICGGRDEGATFNGAFGLLIKSGIVDTAEFPYSSGDYSKVPTATQREAAKPYRISSYAALWYQAGGNDVRDVKARIAAGEPVVLGVPVHDSLYYCDGGWVDVPGPSERSYGDHAVCAVGYDDRAGGGKGGIKIVNSWGTGWGSGGYAYLSYDFMSDYCWEAWVAVDRAKDRPLVSSVSQTSGRAGTAVSITGDNFGVKRGEAAVRFSGAAGTITGWNNSRIEVKVPAGASDGAVRVANWAGEQGGNTYFDVNLSLNSVDPGVARGGDEVKLQGVGLGDKPGQLKVGDEPVTVVSWTDSEITFRAPEEQCSGELTAFVDGQRSNSLQFSVVGAIWYLAEGSTGEGFETWVLVQNPNDTAATVSLAYMTPQGEVAGPSVTVAAHSRRSFNVADTVPGQFEVSTMVTADRPVVAERAMYGNGRKWGTCSIGVVYPADTWYLAEGSTGEGFETWVLVQNPNDTAATVSLAYMTPQGEVAGPSVTVAAHSRRSFNVADTVPGQFEVSTKVTSDMLIVAERAMYGAGRIWAADSVGVSEAAKTWYLAEGSTGDGIESWVLVQNPNDTAATVSLAYMTTQGEVAGPSVTLPAKSRRSFSAADTVPGRNEVSVKVTSGSPVVAERAMYGPGRTWATGSVGEAEPARTWCLAEGSTGEGFETWVLVQNPNDTAATVSLSYMTPQGEVAGPSVTVAAHSRRSFNVADTVLGQFEVSTMVTADRPVVAERAMYGAGRIWGHDSTGSSR